MEPIMPKALHPTSPAVPPTAAAEGSPAPAQAVRSIVLTGVLIASTLSVACLAIVRDGLFPPEPGASVREVVRDRAAAGDQAALIELLRLRIDDPSVPRSRFAVLETFYWAERAWHVDDPPTQRRIAQFVARQCPDPAFDWHWMCRSAE